MSEKQIPDAVVGLRQVLKELKNGNVSQVILASDADEKYKTTVKNAAEEANVPVLCGGTSTQIAETYGIEVKSAVAGILKEPFTQKK